MSKAPTGSIDDRHPWRLRTLSVIIACVVLAGCVAQNVTPDIAALSPDLKTPELNTQNAALSLDEEPPAVVASKATKPDTKATIKTEKPRDYQFVAKAKFDLPALNQDFPSTFGFSGNNIDHLLLGGGASWQSQPSKNAGQVTTPLVLNAGRLFYGDVRGGLHAVSASNGALLWSVHLSDSQARQPIATLFADKNLLYAATQNGHVVAISSKNGAIRWKKKITGSAKNSVKGALRSVGKALLLQTGNNRLLTLSKDDGEAGWVYKSTHPIEAVSYTHLTLPTTPYV